MKLHYYIQRWLLLGLWVAIPATAQDINSLSPSSLPFGGYITGLYHLEADDGSGDYLQEQANGTLTKAVLNTTESGFYFWLVENVYANTFWLYSASQPEQLLQINTDGSIQWTTDPDEETAQLHFRMYPEGPQRTAADAATGITAIGYITTGRLPAGYGNTDCQCNFLTIGSNARFRLHDSGIQADNYRPVVFEKTDDANTLGSVETDLINNVTRIIQNPPAMGIALPHNFVSSNFYVGGFGEDDFQITVASGTEGYIGFLEYTDHHYIKEVYKEARSPIGIKIANDVISLVYHSGDQLLPSGTLGQEVVTDFAVDVPFTLGFKDQDSLIVSQNGSRYGLARAIPAELHFNRSVTQSARILASLVEGTLDIAYTTKNRLINSENDTGTDDGSNLISTHAFFPYNGGNTLVNTFDWQQTQWTVRYMDGVGTVIDNVFSPFYSNNTEFSGIAARFDLSGDYQGGEDFAGTEGWELIKANLGYNADGTVRPQAPVHPYIIFYDRVSGMLRVFVYTNNQGEANQLKVSLSAMNGTPPNGGSDYVPKLWGSLQQFAALDQVATGNYEKVFPFYSGAGRSWYFTDFVMEYDPCIAFFESTISLRVHKITEGNLTMVGRVEGGSIPADTPEYNTWQNQRENFLMGVMDNDFGSLENTLGDVTFGQYENFDLLDFKDTVDGVLVGKEIADWEKEKARIEWEATQDIADAIIAQGSFQIAEGTAVIAEGVSKATDTGIPLLNWGSNAAQGAATAAQGAAIIGQGAATIVEGEANARLAYANKLYYDNIKDKVKHSDQEIQMNVPPPRPQVVFGELALQGTLNIETTLIPNDFVATPGGLNSKDAPEWYVNQSRGSQSLYNRPLGKFTLLKQPEFAIGVAKSASIGHKAWLKIKEKPYFAHNNAVRGKIDDILSISISVETLDSNGSAVRTSTQKGGYTTLYGTPNNPLPEAMDITSLVNWDQINTNSAGLTEQEMEAQLSNWIKVSYEVWSITTTNLKSRDLKRVYANGDQYYDGRSTFAFAFNNTGRNQVLIQEAKTQANSIPGGYDFSDDADFGSTYHLYHTQYDSAGDDFYTAMNNYCTALSNTQNPMAKNAEVPRDVKGEEAVTAEPAVEESTVVQPGLTVYPNPVQSRLNFQLVSPRAGQAVITLYDLTGSVLISSTDYLDGRSTLQGLVNMGSLTAGIYVLEVQLPDGKSITKKIIKQ